MHYVSPAHQTAFIRRVQVHHAHLGESWLPLRPVASAAGGGGGGRRKKTPFLNPLQIDLSLLPRAARGGADGGTGGRTDGRTDGHLLPLVFCLPARRPNRRRRRLKAVSPFQDAWFARPPAFRCLTYASTCAPAMVTGTHLPGLRRRRRCNRRLLFIHRAREIERRGPDPRLLPVACRRRRRHASLAGLALPRGKEEMLPATFPGGDRGSRARAAALGRRGQASETALHGNGGGVEMCGRWRETWASERVGACGNYLSVLSSLRTLP